MTREADTERALDAIVQRRLATDRAYRYAENAEDQHRRELELEAEAAHTLELEHEPEGCAYCESGEAMAHRPEYAEAETAHRCGQACQDRREAEAFELRILRRVVLEDLEDGAAGLVLVLTLAMLVLAAWLGIWAAAVLQHAAHGIGG